LNLPESCAISNDEVQNRSFTITNHGKGGSLFATPVINQPQSAILGVGSIKKHPIVVEDDAIAVRPMVNLSLAFDHRILNGDVSDNFLARIVHLLEEWI
jgi:pyruvate/2-oxoglutarate dehydrogenase complex dihydrolipoamide acyltransferase (E2) component